ncbi:MAG: site-2 protease family protein [Candidatus Thermoplasmatota archaeon]|jgi:Zn-dependent protease|nr:site-2 protease family protein [Candidatus Thermoplasmatota archaeon]
MVTYTVEYKKSFFSRREIRDILISVIALTVGLFFVIDRELDGSSTTLPERLLISFLVVMTAFFLHEMSHKFTAIRFGAWSEFRMWPFGVVLTLLTGFLGFIFALPGAVYFASYRNPIREGKIALAGPSMNLVIGIILLPVLLLTQLPVLPRTALYFLVYINIWLAFFNLIPINPLDGSKVYRWNRTYWGFLFAGAAVLVIPFLLNYITIS